MNLPAHILILAIRLYRLAVSPAQIFFFGSAGGCRFTPTCSRFAVEALQTHGALAGTVLSAKRICRCHPWGGGGPDPVPKNELGIHPRNSKFYRSINFHG